MKLFLTLQPFSDFVDPFRVQECLDGLVFPASKDELINYATNKGAELFIISALRQIAGEEFQTPAEVSQAIGNIY